MIMQYTKPPTDNLIHKGYSRTLADNLLMIRIMIDGVSQNYGFIIIEIAAICSLP